ncbi:MAG: alpha/beta hydrolase, partial [Planctomycetales bacterium]|nr:alpha/beta hydrolase [Planctomycetales bacterium]
QGYLGPALQFHGDQDVVVPLEFGRRLHAAIPGQKRFVLLPGRGHNGALCDVFFAELGEFLDQVLE